MELDPGQGHRSARGRLPGRPGNAPQGTGKQGDEEQGLGCKCQESTGMHAPAAGCHRLRRIIIKIRIITTIIIVVVVVVVVTV